MSATAALVDGMRRVNGAPLLLAGMFAVTLLVALPAAVALDLTLESHLGASLAADTAASGVNYDWWQEFSSQASGLAETFVPSIIGFAALLDNLSAVLDNRWSVPAISLITVVWLLVWSFLSGGVIDRYARRRATRGAGFFTACGMHVWPFARLGFVALAAYYLLFAVFHVWLFDSIYPWITRDITVERTALLVRLVCYLLFLLPLIACTLLFDYARVRIVVEERRSALGALVAGIRFVRRHPGVWLLFLLHAAMYVAVVLVYALVATEAPRSGLRLWVALATGQLYIFARHYVKLLAYASATSYFQRALAHHGYTAAPALVWPESPAAEAILNADPGSR